MAIRCPKCKKAIKKGEVFCSRCGENLTAHEKLPTDKPGIGCLGIFFGFCLLILFCSFIGSGGTFKVTENVIVDAEQFSLISSSELEQIMGKADSSETWTNKTTTGNFEITTKTYDKDGIHYEFLISDDKVVRLGVYSNDYWNREGERFKYDSKLGILEQFNIAKGSNAAKETDNNVTFKLQNVNDKIDTFDVQDMSISDKTYGFVRITYDRTYFE